MHPLCIVCGREIGGGLNLRFSLRDDGSVEASFQCRQRLQGYPDTMHGGVTAALLDGAMTNCLFAHGIAAVTAEMTVRFRHPIELHDSLTVSARIARSQSPLHVIEARIVQREQVKATAAGKFMERPESHGVPQGVSR